MNYLKNQKIEQDMSENVALVKLSHLKQARLEILKLMESFCVIVNLDFKKYKQNFVWN